MGTHTKILVSGPKREPVPNFERSDFTYNPTRHRWALTFYQFGIDVDKFLAIFALKSARNLSRLILDKR